MAQSVFYLGFVVGVSLGAGRPDGAVQQKSMKWAAWGVVRDIPRAWYTRLVALCRRTRARRIVGSTTLEGAPRAPMGHSASPRCRPSGATQRPASAVPP